MGRGDPSGQTKELTGKLSMQEGMMDGDGRVAPMMAMECKRENTGMDVPVFLIWGGMSA